MRDRAMPPGRRAPLRDRALLLAALAWLLSACAAVPPPSATPPAPGATSVTAQATPPATPKSGQSPGPSIPSTLPGRRIVLARETELAVVEGGRERVLLQARDTTAFLSYPRWSPDSSRIAYVETASIVSIAGDWGDDVFAVNPADGSTRLLRPHLRPGEQITGLDWTPDGTSLILGIRQMQLVEGRIAGFEYSVQRYDLETDATVRLVEGGIEPSVSRDGRLISFVRVNETGTVLFVARVDGTQEHEVPLQPRPPFVFSPRLSPDGRAILFGAPGPQEGRRPAEGPLRSLLRLGARRAEAHGVPMEVWRADVTTGAVERFTGLLDDEPRPAWTEDGTVFIIATGAIYEVAPGATNARPIAPGQFNGNLDVASRGP